MKIGPKTKIDVCYNFNENNDRNHGGCLLIFLMKILIKTKINAFGVRDEISKGYNVDERSLKM